VGGIVDKGGVEGEGSEHLVEILLHVIEEVQSVCSSVEALAEGIVVVLEA
jgi:hypothetical protein